MEQSRAKKRDIAMTNKILMGLIALVLGLLFLEILIVNGNNEQRKKWFESSKDGTYHGKW